MRELRGMPVAGALTEQCKERMKPLSERGITPKLAVVRVGGREDDISYEKGIRKRFSAAGALTETVSLPEDATQKTLEETLQSLNADSSVHGILVFRPLPKHLSPERLKELIDPKKGFKNSIVNVPCPCVMLRSVVI